MPTDMAITEETACVAGSIEVVGSAVVELGEAESQYRTQPENKFCRQC